MMGNTRTLHPYIEKRQGYRRGRAILKGTNFPVSSVVVYVLHQGMSPEELVRIFGHLTLAQVYDALSYYYDHQPQLDAEIKKNLGEDRLATRLAAPGKVLRLRYDPHSGDFQISPLERAVLPASTQDDSEALSR